jgi:hypothetical protein
MKAYRANIDRYRKLLTGRLTRVEREYIMRRIAEERAEIKDLEDAGDDSASSPLRLPFYSNAPGESEIGAAFIPGEERL